MPINFRFEGNRPLLRELTADRLNQLIVELQRAKPLPGRGITARQEAGGVRLDVLDAGGSGGRGEASHPFRVFVREREGSTVVGVEPKSYIYSGLPAGGPIIPRGVLQDASNLNDDAWTPASIKYVWLEYDLEDEEGAPARIKFGTDDDFRPYASAFNEMFPSILEASTDDLTFPVFTKARKIIAELVESGGKISVKQFMKSHQLAQDVIVNGIPAIYWFDCGEGMPFVEEQFVAEE